MYKLILFTFLSLNSSITYALSDYELVNFANNRIRGEEEILRETQKSRAELNPYKCTSDERLKLFSKRIFENKDGTSLKVQDSRGNIYTYINGNLFNKNLRPLRRVRGSFLKKAYNALLRIGSFPEGKQLLEELQFSPFKFVILKGGNRYDPSDLNQRSYTHGNEAGFISMLDELQPIVDGFPFQKVGHGGRIYWEPSTKAKFIESDYQERQVDTDIILAHEMFHAYDGMRGLLDRRFVKGDDYEFQTIAEYRAVRMENIMRKALGYKYRRFYSTPTDLNTIQDMLNDYDEPIKMPTPCIKWL